MRRIANILVLLGIVVVLASSCAPTLETLPSVATQTPWIVVVTATPGEEGGDKAQPTQTARVVMITATLGPPKPAETLPTQTPWIVVATPTTAKKATKAPTKRPTRTAAATATLAPTGAVAAATGTEVANTPVPATDTPPPPALTPTLPEPTNTTVAASPTPTSTTSDPGGQIYPPPELIEPTNEAQIEWDWTVVFDWMPVGDLAADEYYRLSLDRPGRQDAWPYYGDWVLTKDPTFNWSGSAKEPFHPPTGTGTALAYWWVTVVRKIGEDETGRAIVKEISAQSEQREMLIPAKP